MLIEEFSTTTTLSPNLLVLCRSTLDAIFQLTTVPLAWLLANKEICVASHQRISG